MGPDNPLFEEQTYTFTYDGRDGRYRMLQMRFLSFFEEAMWEACRGLFLLVSVQTPEGRPIIPDDGVWMTDEN